MLQIFYTVEVEVPVKSGPVLALRAPAPTSIPVPRHPRGWGRYFPNQLWRFSGLCVVALTAHPLTSPNNLAVAGKYFHKNGLGAGQRGEKWRAASPTDQVQPARLVPRGPVFEGR